MFVVKMCGGYLFADGGMTKRLKFATTFEMRNRAEKVAKKWLRNDVPFKVVEKESEEQLINEK